MTVIKVTEFSEFKNLIQTGVSFVKIKSSSNGACVFVKAIFEQAAEKNPNIKFIEIDLDEAREKMPQVIEHVAELPHFELFQNGKPVFQFCGIYLDRINKCIDLLNSRYDKEMQEIKKKEEDKLLNENETEEIENKIENKLVISKEPQTTPTIKTASDSKEFSDLISNGLSLVFISAEWSGPCKKIAPFFDEYAEKNPNLNFIKIDLSDALVKMPSEMSHVRSVPHFELYQNGKLLFQFTGPSIEQINKSVDLLNSRFEKLKVETEKKTVEIKSESQNIDKYEPIVVKRPVCTISDSKTFTDVISSGVAIVHFTSSLSQSSKQIQPLLLQLAEEYSNIKFVEIDIDSVKNSMSKEIAHVTSSPFFELYHNGAKISNFSGDDLVKIKKSVNLLNVLHKTKAK